ncbi:MAG TPA: hypothetical protein VGL83_13265 [Stellaceae bacterium]|jgi:hypothetical protein
MLASRVGYGGGSAVIADLEPEEMERALREKIRGYRSLHAVTFNPKARRGLEILIGATRTTLSATRVVRNMRTALKVAERSG